MHSLSKARTSLTYKFFNLFLTLTFVSSLCVMPTNADAQGVFNLPTPGTMITPSIGYFPATIAGMTIHPENPLQLDFIITRGDDDLQGEAFKKESQKLINYFLATLTVPDEEMWVNLSPYETDRIIADGLGVTEMGRDMLIQDYMLKQLTASLMYPEEELGNEFWKKVYAKSQAKFGTTEIPTNTFNKVWIVPDKATVYVNGTNVLISESHLKVMLEEDYLALESNTDSTKHGLGEMTKDDIEIMTEETKEIIREVILPEIEKEVNEGKTFANLRQIYSSMILGAWYKENLKSSVLGQVYADQNKMNGIDLEDKNIKEKIYNQYVEAFEKGVYNYIKEDHDPVTREMIPRKYFSGGLQRMPKAVGRETGGGVSAASPIRRARGKEGARSVKVNLGLTGYRGGVITSRRALVPKVNSSLSPQGGKEVLGLTGAGIVKVKPVATDVEESSSLLTRFGALGSTLALLALTIGLDGVLEADLDSGLLQIEKRIRELPASQSSGGFFFMQRMIERTETNISLDAVDAWIAKQEEEIRAQLKEQLESFRQEFPDAERVVITTVQSGDTTTTTMSPGDAGATGASSPLTRLGSTLALLALTIGLDGTARADLDSGLLQMETQVRELPASQAPGGFFLMSRMIVRTETNISIDGVDAWIAKQEEEIRAQLKEQLESFRQEFPDAERVVITTVQSDGTTTTTMSPGDAGSGKGSGSASSPIQKSPNQIEGIQRAGQITFDVGNLQAIEGKIQELFAASEGRGIHRDQLVQLIEEELKARGAEYANFNGNTIEILADNEKDPSPWGDSTADPYIKEGTVITIDFGAAITIDGQTYNGDMSRVWAFGAVSEEKKAIYRLVRRSQQVAFDLLRQRLESGEEVTFSELEQAAVDVLSQSRFADSAFYNFHPIGHGTGLEGHEMDIIVRRGNNDVVQEGQVFTIEPGIYMLGAKYRVENTVAIKHDPVSGNLTVESVTGEIPQEIPELQVSSSSEQIDGSVDASPVSFSNYSKDTTAADELSAQTSDELAEMLEQAIFGNADGIQSSRDFFVFTELMLRGPAQAISSASEFETKLPAGTDISEYSGEALVRWLYSRGAIQYVEGSAVPASSPLPIPGGIDFNPNNLDLQEQGQALNFTLDNSMLQNLQPNSVYGIQPVIINIAPIINFVPLLGKVEESSEETNPVQLLGKLEDNEELELSQS